MRLIVNEKGSKKEIITNYENKTVLQIFQENNIYLNSPCGGTGKCGKCKIMIVEGEVEPTLEDKGFFSDKEIKKGLRLGCKAIPKGDCIIDIVGDNDYEFLVYSDYKSDLSNINSGYKIAKINLSNVDFKEVISFKSYIHKSTNTKEISVATLKKLSDYILNKEVYAFVYKDKIINVDSKIKEVYGIAVDIGTTTIAINMVNLLTGELKGSYSCLNSQRAYGADVISRIKAADNSLEALKTLVKKDITKGIDYICEKNEINKENIYSTVIAGNTTMLHLLMGFNVKSLGLFPFTPNSTEKLEYDYIDVFDDSLPNSTLTILPSISTYVGADIVSGILYSDILSSDKINMLIDVGTNGEIAIGNKDRLLAAATAAGPAFEGGNITCGTGSIPGALSTVRYKNGKFNIDVIGDKEPVGICGSALIDIVAEGIKNGWIDYTGLIKEPFDDIVNICDEVFINQKDVREVQLAKSAIRSGIECLIKEYGCNMEDISKVYLAGGFGTHMNIKNTITIGMIPDEFEDKVEFIGNSSLGGAVKYLLHEEPKKEIEKIHDISKDINLSALPSFNDAYIENMVFSKGQI